MIQSDSIPCPFCQDAHDSKTKEKEEGSNALSTTRETGHLNTPEIGGLGILLKAKL